MDKPKSIHFRPSPVDQEAVDDIKGIYGVMTNAAALRLALQQAKEYRNIMTALVAWHGTEAFGIPTQATAFTGLFDLKAAAELQEGINDETT